MLYNLSVLISIAAVIGVAALTGFMIWTWAKQNKKYVEELDDAPLRPIIAVAERKYIGKRYTGPVMTQETVLEYIVDFRLENGKLQTVVVPFKIWQDIQLGKQAELLVQDEFFLDFDHMA